MTQVSTFSTVGFFQVLICENFTYLIYFWKQNFISLKSLVKVMGSKERVMSGVKMFLLFMIKAVAWEKGAN